MIVLAKTFTFFLSNLDTLLCFFPVTHADVFQPIIFVTQRYSQHLGLTLVSVNCTVSDGNESNKHFSLSFLNFLYFFYNLFFQNLLSDILTAIVRRINISYLQCVVYKNSRACRRKPVTNHSPGYSWLWVSIGHTVKHGSARLILKQISRSDDYFWRP